MNKMIVGAIVRHAVSIAGTALAASGYATGSETDAITGGLTALVAVIWSIYQKSQVNK